MANRRSYSPETKAQAIARVLAGEQLTDVCRVMDIPLGTLSVWLGRERPLITETLQSALPVAVERETAVEPLLTSPAERLRVALAEALEESYRTLTTYARHYRDPAWLSSAKPDDALAAYKAVGGRATAIMGRLEGIGGIDSDDSDPS